MTLLPFLAITIDINPIAFSLGPFDIHWYGIGYVVAITAGVWVALPYARRRGLHEDVVWDTLPWAIAAGLIGARLYYVVQNDPVSFLRDPARIPAVWEGGMAFYGGVFAVLGTLVVMAWRHGWPLPAMLDVTALLGMVGQTIGRLGNVINGDVIGPPTDRPWGFIYAHPGSFAPDTVTAYHPAAVYSIIANLVIIAVLVPFRHRFAPGWFAATYLAAYSVSALIVFAWRSEPVIALGLRQAQWTALGLLGVIAVIAAIAWSRGSRPLSPGAPSADA